MSYYPILKAPGCHGWTTLCNYPPNNWEVKNKTEKYINLTWTEDGEWHTENLGMLAIDAMRTVRIEDISGLISDDTLPLLSQTASAPTSPAELEP